MSGKWRTTVSIDGKLAEHVKEDESKFSPLVNKWTEDYYERGRRPSYERHEVEKMKDALNEEEDRMHQMISECFDRQRSRLDSLVDDMGEVEGVDEERMDEVYERVSDWKENTLSSLGDGYVNHGVPRDPEHLAIQTHANNLGIPPKVLIEEIEKRDRQYGFVDKQEADAE